MVFMTFSLSSLVSKAQGDGRQSPFSQGKAAKKEHTIWITDIVYATWNAKFRRVANVTSPKNERKHSVIILRRKEGGKESRREGERERENEYAFAIYPLSRVHPWNTYAWPSGEQSGSCEGWLLSHHHWSGTLCTSSKAPKTLAIICPSECQDIDDITVNW